jgi:hypothetical protein
LVEELKDLLKPFIEEGIQCEKYHYTVAKSEKCRVFLNSSLTDLIWVFDRRSIMNSDKLH